jgi:hypothetical protein
MEIFLEGVNFYQNKKVFVNMDHFLRRFIMKSLLLVLSLVASSSAFADASLSQEQKDTLMKGICESTAQYYAIGEAWRAGKEGVRIEKIESTKVKDERVAVVVNTWVVEEFLLVKGKTYGYYCYRCADGSIHIPESGDRADACK